MSELSDFHDAWCALVDRAFKDYDSLTDDERVWFCIQSLVQAVGNGGLVSYFYNSAADNYEDCLDALSSLDAYRMKHAVEQYGDLFGDRVPEDIEERNRIIRSWPDNSQVRSFLTMVDEEASAECEIVEELLICHIRECGLT